MTTLPERKSYAVSIVFQKTQAGGALTTMLRSAVVDAATQDEALGGFLRLAHAEPDVKDAFVSVYAVIAIAGPLT